MIVSAAALNVVLLFVPFHVQPVGRETVAVAMCASACVMANN